MSAKATKIKEAVIPQPDNLFVLGTLMDHRNKTLVILGIDKIIYRFDYQAGVYEAWELGLVVRAYYDKDGVDITVYAVEAV